MSLAVNKNKSIRVLLNKNVFKKSTAKSCQQSYYRKYRSLMHHVRLYVPSFLPQRKIIFSFFLDNRLDFSFKTEIKRTSIAALVHLHVQGIQLYITTSEINQSVINKQLLTLTYFLNVPCAYLINCIFTLYKYNLKNLICTQSKVLLWKAGTSHFNLRDATRNFRFFLN